MNSKFCEECGEEFFKKCNESKRAFKNRKFCSRECYYLHKTGRNSKTHKYIFCLCGVCGKKVRVYPSDNSNAHYCSLECTRIGRTTKREMACPICKKKFYRIKSLEKRAKNSFCSMECYWKSMRGKPMNCQNPFTKEIRQKMSESQMSRFDREGRSERYLSRRNLYLRRSMKYRLWREAVFKRDKYTCQTCGAKNGEGKRVILNADHIAGFAKLLKRFNPRSMREAYAIPELWDVNNGRTLCVGCHKKTDNYGGKGHGPYGN